ncbi:hypothetical protein HYZ70_03810 [Candidatus Curtissbacteria bacterium]|nr:hypothetical protein [Candidatus Curtissbacteria bacterium]
MSKDRRLGKNPPDAEKRVTHDRNSRGMPGKLVQFESAVPLNQVGEVDVAALEEFVRNASPATGQRRRRR